MTEILDIDIYYYQNKEKTYLKGKSLNNPTGNTSFSADFDYAIFSAHNNNNIFVDVAYDFEMPTKCSLNINDFLFDEYDLYDYHNSNYITKYDCVPYNSYVNDDGKNVITFIFVVDILKELLDSFNDIDTLSDYELQYMANFSKILTISCTVENIRYPELATDIIPIMILHSVNQIGIDYSYKPNEIFYGSEDNIVYVYYFMPFSKFIGNTETVEYDDSYAINYNDDIFYDEIGNPFTINNL